MCRGAHREQPWQQLDTGHEMHASMISELSLRDVTCSNSSLRTLSSPDLPEKRPLSQVSIVQGLRRL